MPYAFEMLQALKDSDIRALSIFAIMEDCVELRLKFENHLNEARILYKDKEDDTLIEVTKYNKRLVKDKNHIDMACEDLFHILTEARFGDDMEIRIRYEHNNEETVRVANRVYEQFKNHSKMTKNSIYARSLHLQFENLSQLRSVLKYVNPTKLKELKILLETKKNNFETDKKILDFGSIVEMDHWKNAKIISLYGFFVNIPLENFSHCEYVSVSVSSISANDIKTLVNIGSNSQCLNRFCIRYDLNEHVTEQFLDSLIGEKRTNQYGRQVRLIGNEIEFIHNSDWKGIDINKFSDKKEEKSTETPNCKPLTSQPSKSAKLCLSNKLIMEKIVQHFDFAELVVLRRVSRGSRYCVDILKPDPKLVAMKISVEPALICVEVFGRNNDKKILYKAPGTDINSTSSYLNYDHKADIDSSSDDLVQLLKDQKTALKELCVFLKHLDEWDCEDWGFRSLDPFAEMVETIFSSRGTFLAVEKLNLTTTCLTRATKLLENLDPAAIKIIELRTMFFDYDVQVLTDLASLEQWSNADELKIQNFVVECDLEKLVHFAKVEIFLYSLSLEDISYLKEKFLLSSNFRQFKAKLFRTYVDNSIFEDNFLGSPFRRVEDISSDQPDIWFFPYTDSVENLQIRYYQKAKEFMFKRVSRR